MLKNPESQAHVSIHGFIGVNMPAQVIKNYNKKILRNSHYGTWEYWFAESVRTGDANLLQEILGAGEKGFSWCKSQDLKEEIETISETDFRFLLYNWAVLYYADDSSKTFERTYNADKNEHPDVLRIGDYTENVYYGKTLTCSTAIMPQELRDFKVRHIENCAPFIPVPERLYELI